MPTWYYFARPTHLAFHDFTRSKTAPKNLRSLLGLGLKFIPTPRYSNKWPNLKASTFDRFKRSLHLRIHFANTTNDSNLTQDEQEAAAEAYNPRMYVKSHWSPPPWTWPRQLDPRLALFDEQLHKLFRRKRGKTNLLPHQHRALRELQLQRDFLIVPCDKNLGPAIIQTEDYIRMAFRDHLNDTTTYKRLSTGEVNLAKAQQMNTLRTWIKKHKASLSAMEKKFLRQKMKDNENDMEEPFARFYLTLKAHKLKPGDPLSALKSRPIVSCPGSLLHPIGIWVDSHLQKIAKVQRSYFRNSYDLKQALTQLDLPPNARLFTADAISMYTNIPTAQALAGIGRYLRRHERDFPNVPVSALCEALRFVMTNNVFTFGDLTFKQLNGTAMGTPPAPPYATLYYALQEENFLDTHATSLMFYKRFIDDVFGIFLCDPDPDTDQSNWQSLQRDMNNARGLEWEFCDRSLKVDFMDLTLEIKNGKIVTSLYEKPMNLHLYIPPHSAHPPGLLPGIVYGTLFRIHTLCSDNEDKQLRTRLFFQRLKARGYKADKLCPLFQRAIIRAQEYSGPSDTETKQTESVIFHLPFHPNDPNSSQIQRAWRTTVAEPEYKMPIWNVPNPKTRTKCGLRRMIIAYRRPVNLGNILSHRNIDTGTGPPVSAYYEPRDM